MKHQFVSYDLAVLLKEKDFNLLTNYFYSQSGKLYPNVLESGNEPMYFEPEDFYDNFNTIVRYEVDGRYQHVTSAPTHQQVIDWLREKHNINIYVDFYGTYFYGIKTYKDQFYNRINCPDEGFKDYYEVLNRAIEEAIKLI